MPGQRPFLCFVSGCRDPSILSQALANASGDYVAENGITDDSLTVKLADRLSCPYRAPERTRAQSAKHVLDDSGYASIGV